MDYYFPENAIPNEVMRYYESFSKKDTQELIDSYNRQVKIGIVGALQQGAHLKAIHQVFMDDFNVSPIYGLHKNIIQLSGHLESIEDLLNNPVAVRLLLKNNKEVVIRLPIKIDVKAPHVNVNTYLSKYNKGVVFYQEDINSVLYHCVGVSNYLMMKFDEDYKFETINFLNSENRVFDISTQAKVAVVLKWPTDIPLEEIKHVEILGNF